MSEREQGIYAFGAFRLDLGRRLLMREDGGVVPLSPKLFDTLAHLVARRGSIVGKDELMSAVWSDTIVEENNLNKNISRLRRALGETLGENRFIATIPGKGYQFVADVRAAGEVQPPAAAEFEDELSARAAAGGAIASPRAGRFWPLLAILAFTLGVGMLAFFAWRGSSPPGTVRSLAVLPFRALAADEGRESLELGMADAVIARLSGIEALAVRPLSSVRKYESAHQDSLEAGRELNTDAVVEGTIQFSETRIRVSARLLRSSDGRQLWAGRFDEPLADIFAVQDSISQKVASALQMKLAGHPRRHPENLEAYDSYLNGRFHTLRLTPPEIRKGILYYEQAIGIEPDYARAYAGLADAHRTLGLVGGRPDAFLKAKQAAKRAIEIDDRLAEGHAILGFVTFWYDWDWAGAERALRHALKLDPHSPDAQLAYAHLLSNTGRHAEALAAARRASELDPLNVRTRGLEVMFLLHAGKADEVAARHEEAFALAPDFWVRHQGMTALYIERGMYEEAAASGRKAVEASGGNPWAKSLEGYALAKSGKLDAARSVLHDLLQDPAVPLFHPHTVALVYAALDENDEALQWLERAFERRDPGMTFLKVDRKWDGLRGDPRFTDLMRRMNFND